MTLGAFTPERHVFEPQVDQFAAFRAQDESSTGLIIGLGYPPEVRGRPVSYMLVAVDQEADVDTIVVRS